MTKNFALFILGLVLTAGGAGGVEHSVTDTELLKALAVSVVGLVILALATLNIKKEYS